jgi:hypothetical protein
MTKLRFLERVLQDNARFYDIITANEFNEIYLEALFRELFENSCEGIESKVAETRPDVIGFLSLLSELEFAKYFTKRKMKVKLLSCNEFERRSPPDIWVHSGSKEYLVEVKNIEEDRITYSLGRKIASILNPQGHSFAIIVGSLNSMSIPTYFHETRREKEKHLQQLNKEGRAEILTKGARDPRVRMDLAMETLADFEKDIRDPLLEASTAVVILFFLIPLLPAIETWSIVTLIVIVAVVIGTFVLTVVLWRKGNKMLRMKLSTNPSLSLEP